MLSEHWVSVGSTCRGEAQQSPMVGRASPGQVRWASPGGKPAGQALGKPFDWLWGSRRPVRGAWQPDSVSGGYTVGVGFKQKGFKLTTLYIREGVISISSFQQLACWWPWAVQFGAGAGELSMV